MQLNYVQYDNKTFLSKWLKYFNISQFYCALQLTIYEIHAKFLVVTAKLFKYFNCPFLFFYNRT